MRALVYERYGPPHEVLRLVDLPQPTPGPGEVLVRVRAASVNSWDLDLLTGSPLGRLEAPFKPKRQVLGADIAGTVEAVGDGVSAFLPGDHVFGDLSEGKWGGFAEYAVARAGELAHIPSGLSFVKAAALPQAGALALQALRSSPSIGPQSDVLINGAGGGVGTFAVQMAIALGVSVTGIDHAVKDERVHSLGASRFRPTMPPSTATCSRAPILPPTTTSRPPSFSACAYVPGERRATMSMIRSYWRPSAMKSDAW